MDLPVFDCHADTPYALWRMSRHLLQNDCHVSLVQTAKLPHYAQFFAYCTYAGEARVREEPEMLYRLPRQYMDNELSQNRDAICFCTDAEGVENAWGKGKAAALYALEGPEAIDCDPGRLDALVQEGVRMTTLTWNADNALAGCHASGRGLSDRGREFVKKAQQLGMLIDLSHCSDRAFFDALELAPGQVLASHSDSRALCARSRNLTDEMYLTLCQTGGLTGINLYADFLSEGEATLDDVYAHIDHFLSLSGDSHVALGGDLDGCDRLPRGFASAADYLQLGDYLLRHYTHETVEKLFYRNILELLRKCKHE